MSICIKVNCSGSWATLIPSLKPQKLEDAMMACDAIAVGMHREIFAAPTKPVESAELAIEVSALVIAFVLIYIALTAVADYRIAYRLIGV